MIDAKGRPLADRITVGPGAEGSGRGMKPSGEGVMAREVERGQIRDLGRARCLTTEIRSSSAKGFLRTLTEPCVRSARALAAGSFLAAVRTTGIFWVFGIALRQWHVST